MATIERPQSFRNKMDEWLYVMGWTTRKSREASPPLFAARAVFSVVQGGIIYIIQQGNLSTFFREFKENLV